MALPPSFARDGFSQWTDARKRMRLPNGQYLKPLLIGTDGETNTGKSEFMLSCPGPGIAIIVDRGIDGTMDNPNPPSKRSDFAFKVVLVPTDLTASHNDYIKFYHDVRDSFYKALSNPDVVTVAIDGDSDFWEIQKLAEFGKLKQVWPQTKYGDLYIKRRAILYRAYDSGKIIIGTNKIRDEWVPVIGRDGLPLKDKDGQEIREKSGNKQRQGFPDQDYLWQIQLRHLYQPPTPITAGPRKGQMLPGKWGIRILKCKARPELQGETLWGEQCNFRGLVELVYPNVPLAQWGL